MIATKMMAAPPAVAKRFAAQLPHHFCEKPTPCIRFCVCTARPQLAFVSAFAQHAHTLHSFLRLHSTQQAPRQVSTATHPARSAHPSPLYTAQTVFGSSHTLRMPTLHPVLSRLPLAKPRLNIEAGVAPEARIAQLLAPLAISACMIPASASHGCSECAFS